MEQRELTEKGERRSGRDCERRSSGFGIMQIAGGIALIGLAALVIAALPDIRRYIKINRM